MILSAFFFFNDTATTEIYTLSLHDALPISRRRTSRLRSKSRISSTSTTSSGSSTSPAQVRDRKSTRLNSSHLVISYAVFCLKKKRCPLPSSHEARASDRESVPE